MDRIMNLHEPKKLKDCETLVDFAYRERYAYLTNVEKFQITFGVPLKKFWPNNLVGFDIIAFDKWIGTGDKCLRDAIVEKYNEDAAQLVERLIHVK